MMAYMSARHTLLWWMLAATVIGLVLFLSGSPARGAEPESSREELALGRELFLREWVANDSRSHGGDGLGPVFNDSSCVACHNLGGTGGAGPHNKNVEIISAFHSPSESSTPFTFAGFLLHSVFGIPESPRAQPKVDQKQLREKLAKIHPGFRSAGSVVLHRFGTDQKYESWKGRLGSMQFTGQIDSLDTESVEQPDETERAIEQDSSKPQSMHDLNHQQRLLRSKAKRERQIARNGGFTRSSSGRIDEFNLVSSDRNTPALFGAGLINSIPDKAIEAGAAVRHADFPKVAGRVSRLADGKIGRFGWKAQKASLREFAMTACAVELGLQVPEQEQAGLGYNPKYKAPGLDMTLKECDALVSFLRKLPAPAQHPPATAAESKYLQGGRDLFASTGCAVCHTPKLAKVDGIYSDLLLHDLGVELGDTGSYGVFAPGNATDDLSEPLPSLTSSSTTPAEMAQDRRNLDPKKKIVGAMRQEWRTPPLWGVRDSGPYLHDGRADTLEQAIAFHGGEGEESSQRYFALSSKQRLQLTSFLKSLVAPEQVASARP